MQNYPIRQIVITLIAALFAATAVGGLEVSAQGPEVVFVTSPGEGETVSDIITVTGAVDFWDFQKYDLFLKTGDSLVWGATGYAPVINGNLARLDTKIFVDGTYQVLIRLVRNDSNYTEFAGPMITIANNLGAPLPHPEIDSSLLYPPLSNKAIIRIRNCSGRNIEFDYVGITGGCSHDNLWIMAKTEDMPLCTTEDALVNPCTYRGTAVGEGEERGATYELVADGGKIYTAEYAGEGRLFLNEIPGDERAETDTGGQINLADETRFQNPPEPLMMAGDEQAEAAPAEAAMAPAPTPAPAATEAPAAAAPAEESTGQPEGETQAVLPESGQAAQELSSSFVISAVGLLLLMLVGGVVAVRKGKEQV